MTLVYMFPGQSSRYPTMLQKLTALHAPNREILLAASDILHRDLSAHYQADNPDVFAQNRDIQVGVFLANHMFLQILDAAGIRADLSAGLSLGEYNHLVHIGALELKQALLIVEQRGLAYDAGPLGAMASIFPIDLEELEQVALRAASKGALEVVNLNSPRQHVLSGEHEALQEALRILEEEFYVQATVIERRVPMHCSIFEPVGQRFRRHLEQVTFARPHLPYLPNRLGCEQPDPDRSTFVELLATHVHQPVLWRNTIDWVAGRCPDAVFVEVGPLSVLHNLLDRKWHRNRKLHTDSAEETDRHLHQVIDELRARPGASPGLQAVRAEQTLRGLEAGG